MEEEVDIEMRDMVVEVLEIIEEEIIIMMIIIGGRNLILMMIGDER